MKVLVTGGAGFIGSHLVAYLTTCGHDVVVVDNFLRGNKLEKEILAAIELVEGDIRDEELMVRLASDCRWIFHLAAYLGVDLVADNPVEAMETEAIGTRSVVRAAIVNGVEKFIYASTSGVYGKAAIEQAVDEEFTASPSSSYSIAKRYNEIYLQSVYQETGLQSFPIRYFNVYGPRQDNRMVIPRFFEQAVKGDPVTVYGTGQQSRDFTYVQDAVLATVRTVELVTGNEMFNVAKGGDTSILELAQLVVAMCESQSEVRCIEPPTGRYDFEVQRRCGNSDKLEKFTGFRPSTGLQEGLRQVYESIINK